METRKGIPVSPGIAIGEAFLLDTEGVRIPKHFITEEQVESEKQRLEKAMDEALHEVEALSGSVAERAGDKIAEIFAAHAGMLTDEYFRKEFFERIEQKRLTAEFATSRTMRRWRKMFMEDPFLHPRISDLNDLERRILRHLVGGKREELANLTSEIVLVARDLGPSETAMLDTSKVKAFATETGGPTSHTAIVARALGIPAVVGLSSLNLDVDGGDKLIVDGSRGLIIVKPDEQTLGAYRSRMHEAHETDQILLRELHDLPAETTDGVQVEIYANIEFPREVPSSLEHGALGIGLYRTEFLYLTSDRMPTEEEQFKEYMHALELLGDREIIIRTLDLGADKFSPYMQSLASERNPFLGARSIRYCLDNPGVFRVQLHAILRASAYGNVKIMLPLISTLEEIKKAKLILNEVKADLDNKGIAYNREVPLGVMVEVPSAAMCADLLAPEVDFFSIGTNDLIQYTLAVDRSNEQVAHLYAPAHPAILRMIRATVEAADLNNIPVSLCGEMASDIMFTVLLVGLGVRKLSVAPPAIMPEIKKIIRSISLEDARKLMRQAMALGSAAEIERLVLQTNRELCPGLFA